MDLKEYRCFAAVIILAAVINKVSNPAKTAVFWTDELIKELEDDDTAKETGRDSGNRS